MTFSQVNRQLIKLDLQATAWLSSGTLISPRSKSAGRFNNTNDMRVTNKMSPQEIAISSEFTTQGGPELTGSYPKQMSVLRYSIQILF